ncbi:MAG: hypothetical protein M3Z40_06275, partial [Bifidobacterium sp.]|nr:hypothetical protein [Bifidobacterium sp.]
HGYKYANGDPKVQTPAWQIALYVALVVLALIFLALEYLAFRRFKARRSAVDVGTLNDLADDARQTRAQDPASMESTPSEDSSDQGPTA